MNAVLLGLTLLAVGWVCIWSVKDHTKQSKTWWPFAMRDVPTAAPNETDASSPEHRNSNAGSPAPRPWRRSRS
jgi:hypothetical protein